MVDAFGKWLESILGPRGLVVFDSSDPAAKPLAASPDLRAALVEVKRRHEQTIDRVSKDVVLEAAFSAAATERAKAMVESFERFIEENKDEITAQARRIGTFEISTLPDQDCCQLFVPRHPATSAKLGEVRAAEAGLDVDGLIRTAMAGTEEETFEYP